MADADQGRQHKTPLAAARTQARRRPALLCAVLACLGALGADPFSPGAQAARRTAADAVDSVDAGGADQHRFVLIGHSAGKPDDDKRLRRTIDALDGERTAFLVAAGIKGDTEPCSDKLYQKRRELLDSARRPVIVVLAGSDWTSCTNSTGRSAAIERLSRLRELLYGTPEALGAGKLALTRQSSSARFRGYAENAHWTVGKVLYATLNLPANNNHYLSEAGRNSEYEDRLVANRYWLNRLFTIARRDKFEAVVLFADGDLKALAQPTGLRALLARAVPEDDGFAATRRQVVSLAQKFSGKVLLVDSAPPAGAPPPPNASPNTAPAPAAEAAARPGARPTIEWRGNLGHLSTGQQAPQGALEVEVEPSTKRVFTVRAADTDKND